MPRFKREGVFEIFKIRSGERGSLTVEASIVIPVVILSIFAFINLSLLLFRQSHLQAAADIAARQGALSWRNIKRDIETGRISVDNLNEPGLYWRLYDSRSKDKEERLLDYLDAKAKRGEILAAANTDMSVNIRDYVIYKKLEVKLEHSYKIPGANFLRMFGFNEYYKITARSEAVVNDPVELIRNMDFIIDVEKELEEKHPGIKNLAEKTRGVLKEISGTLKKLAGE